MVMFHSYVNVYQRLILFLSQPPPILGSMEQRTSWRWSHHLGSPGHSGGTASAAAPVNLRKPDAGMEWPKNEHDVLVYIIVYIYIYIMFICIYTWYVNMLYVNMLYVNMLCVNMLCVNMLYVGVIYVYMIYVGITYLYTCVYVYISISYI